MEPGSLPPALPDQRRLPGRVEGGAFAVRSRSFPGQVKDPEEDVEPEWVGRLGPLDCIPSCQPGDDAPLAERGAYWAEQARCYLRCRALPGKAPLQGRDEEGEGDLLPPRAEKLQNAG